MMGWCFRVMGGIVGSLVLLAPCGGDGMKGAYSQGASLAQGISKPTPSDPGIVPGYQGAEVAQTQLADHDLDAVNPASSQVKDDEAGSLLFQNSQERERFTIDPHTDPLFKAANEVVANPEKVMSEEMVEETVPGGSGEETHICEESGEETLEEGEEFWVVRVNEPKHLTKIVVYSHGWAGGLCRNVITGQQLDSSQSILGHWYGVGVVFHNLLPVHLQKRVKSVNFPEGFDCPHYLSLSPEGILSIRTGSGGGWWFLNNIVIDIEVLLQAGEEDVKETIENNCQYLEERVDQGLCAYEDVIVMEGPQTRVINGYPVTKDWWRRKRIYRCHYPCQNNCGALRERGCWQVKSSCKQKVGDVCVVWEQTYQCPSGQIGGRSWRSSGKGSPFCLSGDCASKLYAPNADFANVMAQLSVLKEAQKGVQSNLPVFKGEDKRCTRDCLGFRDCCGNGRGWGVSVKVASCGAEEKKLAKLREKGRCIQIGTYCDKKVLGKCISKKTTFCCYNSRLAKVVQEQGRHQLGLGRGDPKDPRCEGLSIEQLSRLDFSRINFAEAFGDVMADTKVPQGQKMTQDIQKSMAQRGSLMGVQAPPPTRQEALAPTYKAQGRGHGQF